MIKKIKVNQLKVGMYVHDFNCGWLNHPFFLSSKKVDNAKTIEAIVHHGIRELYIDSSKGLDVYNAPTKKEVDQQINKEIKKVTEKEVKTRVRVQFEEEVFVAKKIKDESKQTIQNIMNDIRLGKQITAEKTEHAVERMIDSIYRNQNALLSLTKIREVDEYTYMHSVSVSALLISFGKHLGYDSKLIKELGIGGMLHDIGKMKVPEEILNKRGSLTNEEYEIMKEHVVQSRILLEKTEGISDLAILLASQHHERMDGTGYPNAYNGDEISVYGQMIAIVDVYDALTTNRCYRQRHEPTEVLKSLFEWSKYHFSSELVQEFIRCVGIYPAGSLVRLESGLLAVVLNHGEQGLLDPVVRVVYNIKADRLLYPYNIDLSNEKEEKIICHELPDKWNITPEKYIA